MQKVILISGKKQSGKSTLRNYIIGKILVNAGVLDTFNISTKGELLVPTGKEYLEALDVNIQTPAYIKYATENIWPHVKNYSLANSLKQIAMDMFGLDYLQCFGTDEEKNTETNIRWSDISFALPPRRVGEIKRRGVFDYFMTGREFMETFGSFIRSINVNAFANKTIADVMRDMAPISIVDDVRFPNEFTIFKEKELAGELQIISIRLLRNPHNSEAESETALDDAPLSFYSIVIDNKELELKDYLNAADEELEKIWNG